MRRSDREVTDFKEIIEIIERCDVCRLALHDDEYPYILPLNFGHKVTGQTIILYFHGAATGKKYELIKRSNKAAFEMDCSHRLVTDKEAGNCTMEYESIIGQGTITLIDNDQEKMSGLNILMQHYPVDKDFKFNEAIVPQTTVMKLTITTLTAKRRMI